MISSKQDVFSSEVEQAVFARRSFLQNVATSALVPIGAMSTMASASVPTTMALGTTGAIFNVKDYGALGNGTTPDDVAIQNTINAAKAAGGGIVLFPAGRYLINASLNASSSPASTPITIEGVGPAASVIVVPSTATFDAVVVTGMDGFAMREIGISSPTDRTAGRGIYLDSTTNCLIDHVNMTGQFMCCEVSGGYIHRIRSSLWTVAANGTGFQVSGANSNDTCLYNIYTINGYCGFRLRRTGSVIMNACESLFPTYGLLIDPAAGQIVSYSFFVNCVFDSTYYACINISAAGGAVRGLTFTNCWAATTSHGDCCVVAGDVDGVDFVASRFLNSSIGNGVMILGPAKNVHFDSCVAALSGNGFCANLNAQYFAFRNCYAGPYAGLGGNTVGIQVVAGCSNYMITNNIIKGNISGSLIDSGSAPKVVGSNLT